MAIPFIALTPVLPRILVAALPGTFPRPRRVTEPFIGPLVCPANLCFAASFPKRRAYLFLASLLALLVLVFLSGLTFPLGPLVLLGSLPLPFLSFPFPAPAPRAPKTLPTMTVALKRFVSALSNPSNLSPASSPLSLTKDYLIPSSFS